MSTSRRNFLIWSGRGIAATAACGLSYKLLGKNKAREARQIWQIDPQKCTFCGKCETACVRTPSAAKAVNNLNKCDHCVICYGHITNTKVDPKKVQTEGKKVCPYDAVIRKLIFDNSKDNETPEAPSPFDNLEHDPEDMIESLDFGADETDDDNTESKPACACSSKPQESEPISVDNTRPSRLDCNTTPFREFFSYTIDHNKCTGCGDCVQLCLDRGMASMSLIIRPDLCLDCNECNISIKCPENAIFRMPLIDNDDLPSDIGVKIRREL